MHWEVPDWYEFAMPGYCHWAALIWINRGLLTALYPVHFIHPCFILSNVTFQRWSGLIWVQKSNLHSLAHTFAYTCWQQKTSCVTGVPTPIVFPVKRHPSKLMGCNHHHKYSVTRPTARSWVFNSQSMGCKEWQAWGTQFPISLTTPSKDLEENPTNFAVFQNLKNIPSGRPQSGGGTFIRCAFFIQSILLTLSLHRVSGAYQHCHLVK